MKKYDLLKDEPFEAAEVPAPVELKSAEDYAQLTQHLVSVYRLQLNLVYRQHGYEARQQLLTMMVLLLSGIMPVQYPDYIRYYPESLKEICALVGNFLVADSRLEKKAG